MIDHFDGSFIMDNPVNDDAQRTMNQSSVLNYNISTAELMTLKHSLKAEILSELTSDFNTRVDYYFNRDFPPALVSIVNAKWSDLLNQSGDVSQLDQTFVKSDQESQRESRNSQGNDKLIEELRLKDSQIVELRTEVNKLQGSNQELRENNRSLQDKVNKIPSLLKRVTQLEMNVDGGEAYSRKDILGLKVSLAREVL